MTLPTSHLHHWPRRDPVPVTSWPLQRRPCAGIPGRPGIPAAPLPPSRRPSGPLLRSGAAGGKFPFVLTGQAAHEAAVARLRASYAAIPRRPAPVRLAKKTSNLFRPRAATDAPGPRRLRPRRRDRRSTPRRSTADVQGMCTYEDLVDATLPARPDPATSSRSCARSRSAARSPASASSRPASATACRTSRCSRWTSSPAPARSSPTPARASRPVRHLPQLLRLARLRHPAADRARAGAVVRRAAARPLRRRRPARQDRSPTIIETRRVRRRPGRRPRRRRVRSRASTT